jgi:hypothetical protein
MPVKLSTATRAVSTALSTGLASLCSSLSLGPAAWGALRPASEDRSGQTTAGRKFASHYTPFGANSIDDIMKNLVHGIFIEDAKIAIGEKVHLESLEFDAVLARHILDGDSAIVGHSGFRTNGRVFRKARGDDVAGVLIGPGIKLG